ncbi:hypothetical protein MACJ_001052 [Theileria orientalis]|uniref:Uncharacterized protein n=1 Tax=Theileria orientalis TaxID=68886 RepID=A0A976QW22_THEOR|nr:hypothetical protein MACJ_001052 [Theileria orientalis]
MEVPDLVLDPKRSSNYGSIKNRLNQQNILMDGVIIDIDKTYPYKYGHVHINPSHCVMDGYEVFTHEMPSQEPFHVTQINFNEKALKIKDIASHQVISIHAISEKHSEPFKPISVCVVKYVKNNENIYEWYFRDNLDSNEWKLDEKFAEHLDHISMKNYINKLYDNLFELDIDINKEFFYYNGIQPFTNKGLKGQIHFSTINSRFKKYIYSLNENRNFKLKSLTINDKAQIINAKKGYSQFYIVCDDRQDKEYPLFLCFPDSTNNYQWYTRIHYGSDNWIESEELKHCNPKYEIKDSELEKAYLKLFWIDVDIDYNERLNLKNYVRNSRDIGKKTITNGNYMGIETVKYNFYPLYIRMVQNGKPIESIDELEEMHSVCVFYDFQNKPQFIAFERADPFDKYVWYYRDEYSDEWRIYEKLRHQDPRKNNYRLNEHNPTEYYVEFREEREREKEEEEKSKTITAQAVGTTVGTAACCGLGYFIYTNASSITGMVSSLFS